MTLTFLNNFLIFIKTNKGSLCFTVWSGWPPCFFWPNGLRKEALRVMWHIVIQLACYTSQECVFVSSLLIFLKCLHRTCIPMLALLLGVQIIKTERKTLTAKVKEQWASLAVGFHFGITGTYCRRRLQNFKGSEVHAKTASEVWMCAPFIYRFVEPKVGIWETVSVTLFCWYNGPFC